MISGAWLKNPPTKDEAEAFCQRWAASLEARLPWYRQQLQDAGGPAADGSTAVLDDHVRFVVTRLGTQGPVESVPEWWDEKIRGRGWTAYGAALAEGLMAYVADIYRQRAGSGADWVVEGDQRDGFFRCPVFRDHQLTPSWVQVNIVVAAQWADRGTRSLRETVEYVLTSYRDLHTAPTHEGPEAAIVGVDPTDVPGWTFEVSLREDIADVLGQQRYAGLEDAFAAVPGVQAAMFEDREVCLVRTTLAAGDLQRRLAELLQ